MAGGAELLCFSARSAAKTWQRGLAAGRAALGGSARRESAGRSAAFTQPGGTPHDVSGAGGAVGAAAVGAGWFAGGGRGGCRLQHTTRGSVKRRKAPGGLPWRAGAGARRHGRLVRRRFALPLLYAERARHWPGGLMGGPGPRAAVRQAAPVTAGGGRSGRMVGAWARLFSTQRDSGGCRVGVRWSGTLRWRAPCRGGRRVWARSVKSCSLPLMALS